MTLDRRSLLKALSFSAVLAACGWGTHAATAGASSTARATGTSPVKPTASPHPKPTPTPRATLALPAEVGHGSRTGTQVSLTFHGGGDPALGTAILAALAKRRTHVTVFAIGLWLEANPTMAAAILGAGHELGNHTYSHQPMRDLSASQDYSEIEGCKQVLKTQTGTPGAWFRASGTQHTNSTIRDEARRAGYDTCISYDVDSLDYTDPGSAAVVANVAAAVQPGSIVSLHFGHSSTVGAIGLILDLLASRGLQPVTVGRLLTG